MYEFRDVIYILKILEEYFFYDQDLPYISRHKILKKFDTLRLQQKMHYSHIIYDFSILLYFSEENVVELIPRNINNNNIDHCYTKENHVIFGNIDTDLYNDLDELDSTQFVLAHYKNNIFNLTDKNIAILNEIASIIMSYNKDNI